MQKRICPNCLTRWYSSDSSKVWKCESCGHEIPEEKEDPNIRVLPKVCEECKDLILPPFNDLHKFQDNKCTNLILVCRKCKNKK